ncbi:cytochrome c3 family protein [Thermodesulfitimonas autotrophica]|uniref:cytochrome c3 family protein n=1 Tax=Thermodesulfitimonas autotrophica TaxID=1894989 RepID=UPI002FDF1E5A
MPAAAYDNPHGPYDNFPAGCAACHVAHAATGPNLLSRAATNTTALCLTCHDGTGSVFNVVYVTTNQEVYGLGFYDTAAMHFHPVRDMGNPLIGQSIGCTDCHNPHGDMSVPGQVYARLLSAFDGTTRQHQGPNFCLACHGSVDRGFPSVEDPAVSYWVYALGDHTNPDAAHYLTDAPELLPPSGTKVTCAKCHYKHAAANPRLLAKAGAELCWSCHYKDKSSSIHPVKAFSKTGSVHNVDGANGTKLTCTSCHGPHTANYVTFSASGPGVYCFQCHPWAPGQPITKHNPYKLEGVYSVISDPDNTKKRFAGAAGAGLGGLPNTVGDLSDFCIKCHDGDPPKEKASPTEFVPVTVVFPETPFTTNTGGWDKKDYKASAHGGVITCGECHESHGSDYPALQRYKEDTPEVDGECLRCHNSSKVLGAPDIKSDLLAAASHPTLTVTGVHKNTEDYTKLQKRHAECADCHDVHVATKDKAIKGVSGVFIDPKDSSWNDWPGNATFTSTLELKRPINAEHELCFKCHSYYSYGSTPPSGETDQAKEFNPNNVSYHAVWGGSRMQQFEYPAGSKTYYYYGKFTGSWSATSPMKCSDCHGSPSGVRGPHGSQYAFILKAPWNPDTGTDGKSGTGKDTRDHLCFLCHDYNFYAGTDEGSATERSKFSGSCGCDGGGKYSYNLHAFHVGRKGYACAACHGAIPHGYKKRGILVERTDPAPYSNGSYLKVYTWKDPGAWTKPSCDHSSPCHGGM